MRKLSLIALAAFAAAGMSTVQMEPGSGTPTVAQQSQRASTNQAVTPAKTAPRMAEMPSMFGSGFGTGSRGRDRRRGPGWTQAHVQRMARKKRNQARHRKACKG